MSDNPDGVLTGNTSSKIFSLAIKGGTGVLAAGDMDFHQLFQYKIRCYHVPE